MLGIKENEEGIPILSDIPIASNRILLDQYLGVSSSDLTESEIWDLRPDVYREISKQSADMRVFKVHDAFGYDSSGNPIFPVEVTRSVVYIIRNPLDIAVSYSFHSGKSFNETIQQLNDPQFSISNNENELKHQVSQHLGSWSNHVCSWLDQEILPVTFVRFEQLLEDCRKEFKRILSTLDIPYNNETLDKAIKASDFAHLQELENAYGFREKPIQSTSFFREGKKDVYRDHLNVKQTNSIDEHHHAIMKRFGYQLFKR